MYVRKTAVTAHHPCGTCRMGVAGDDGAVVDSELCVHGIERLRVVDASVFPDLVGGNINARYHDRREGERSHFERAEPSSLNVRY